MEGPKVLVHGGGVMASEMLRNLGIEPVMKDGRRITDAATLKVVTMVYAGWCAKNICARLQALGCNAVSLAGCDGAIITAAKRPVGETDWGYVGDLNDDSVNAQALRTLIGDGFVPVVCAIGHDGSGQLLNTNADTVASALASALGAELHLEFELSGVLKDKDDPESLIESIKVSEIERLKTDGTISGGMIPKIDNAARAILKGA